MTNLILIADDEKTVRQLLELVLQGQGYEVIAAANGNHLIRLAQEFIPDLVLVDLMMPELDGYEAIRQLRNDRRTAHIPLIILSARSSPNDVVTGFQIGADDYVTKPFNVPELLARIKQQLQRTATTKNARESTVAWLEEKLIEAARITKAADIASFRFYVPPSIESELSSEVLIALDQLQSVVEIAKFYQLATSPVSQRDGLLEATEILQQISKLATYFYDYGVATTSFELAINNWKQLIADESARLIRPTVWQPLANPYIVGTPVSGQLFVGRESLLQQLDSLWQRDGVRPSVVLYGHRRMGKTSILHHLQHRYGSDTIVVNLSMQRLDQVQHTGELLYRIALYIYDQCHRQQLTHVEEPQEAAFGQRTAYIAFDRWLGSLAGTREHHRIILALDEFELLEEWIAQGLIDPKLLAYLRDIFMNYTWLTMAFAGLHKLEQLRHDYWSPLFGSVFSIPVGFLDEQATTQLLTQPSPDFALNYSPEALTTIYQLTNGQPYLVQLLGHHLVTHFNQQHAGSESEDMPTVTEADVAFVQSSSAFFHDGRAYFTGVWQQALQESGTGQRDILVKLSQDDCLLSAIVQATGRSEQEDLHMLATLQDLDIVTTSDRGYTYTVKLMQQWVEMYQRC